MESNSEKSKLPLVATRHKKVKWMKSVGEKKPVYTIPTEAEQYKIIKGSDVYVLDRRDDRVFRRGDRLVIQEKKRLSHLESGNEQLEVTSNVCVRFVDKMEVYYDGQKRWVKLTITSVPKSD